PSGAPDVAPLYCMPFPERFTSTLIDLTRATQRAGADAPRTIQIRWLIRALRALVPDLVSEDVDATAKGRTWLYALAPVRGAAQPDDHKGAQLISWPPLPWKDVYFSVLLTLTVQTVPFQPYPVVYIETGVRRWMSSAPQFLGRGDRSVYLKAAAPWLEAVDAS